MSEIYDLSQTISDGMTTWPGDPVVKVVLAESTTEGADFNVSDLRMGSHTGTHVDAPHHVTDSGASVDHLPLDVLIGQAWVCHFDPSVRMISAQELAEARIPMGTMRLLLGTSNSTRWSSPHDPFDNDFVALTPDGAEWLVEHGVRLVGIDCLSIGSGGPDGLAVHRALLTHGVVVVEGLNLGRLPGGPCTVCCLPLKLDGADGAPARVVALRS